MPQKEKAVQKAWLGIFQKTLGSEADPFLRYTDGRGRREGQGVCIFLPHRVPKICLWRISTSSRDERSAR